MIKLNKNWAMDNDGICVTIFKHGILGKNSKTPGAESWKPVRYYNNYVEAMKGIVDLDISTCKSWEVMIDRLADLRADIERMLPNIPKPTPKNKALGL